MSLRDNLLTLLCRLLSLLFAPFTRQPKGPINPDSILVIKPCCIGDLLMATAAIAQLRRAFPKARLDVAVGAWARPVLANNLRIDNLVECVELKSPSDYLSLIQRVRKGSYDLSLVLDRSPFLTLAPFLAGVPVRAGLDSDGRGFSLNLKVAVSEERHEAELYLDVVRCLGVPVQEAGTEFFPTAEDRTWAKELLGERTPGSRRIALHPGGGVNPGMHLVEKRWKAQGFGEVARRFIESGAQVLLVGSTEDKRVAEEIYSSLGRDVEKLLDSTGRTTLSQLGALLELCDLFVGNDAGPTHLAAAIGTPVLAIFGPSKPYRYAPYTPRKTVIHKENSCATCTFRGGLLLNCYNGLRCLEEVTADDVWKAALSLLEDARGTEPL